jgi:exodeoxyribonuclease V beta subunit
MPELVPEIGESVEGAVRDLWDEKVAADERLASHALAGKWKIGDDLQLALMATGQDEYVFVPAPSDLDQLLHQIDECSARLSPADLEALREFMGRVPEELWNASAKDPRTRERCVQGLGDSDSFANWMNSVRWVASLGLTKGGHIKGNSKVGKTLAAEAALLDAVKIASEATALAADVQWAWQTYCAREATQRARARMETDRLITYDGLISRVRDALVLGPGRLELSRRLRERYKVALVDESQDTDPRQFDIFRTVFLGAPGGPAPDTHRLVLVGDPKQAIYAFRGADLNTYLEARHGAPPDQVFTLRRTFRAPPKLVKATNAIFTREG